MADLRSKDIVRNVFIITASDQQNLLREALKACNGAAGRRSDRIVIILNPIDDPHQLDPVLYTAKISGNMTHRLITCNTLERTDGGHIIFYIVDAGQ